MKNVFYIALLTTILLVGCSGGVPLQSNSAQSFPPTLTPTNTIEALLLTLNVTLDIKHGEFMIAPVESPAFGILISGWVPNGEIVIYLIGQQGEQIPIVPMETPVHATSEGVANILVAYEMDGVYPGWWLLLVAGDSGAHTIDVAIPRIIPPDDTHSDYILDFDFSAAPTPTP